jgi:hypothetical protein
MEQIGSQGQRNASQQPIIHQTTVVDSKAAAWERQERDNLMQWVILVLLFLVLVLGGAIVAIVLVLLLPTTTSTAVSDPTPDPTSSPTGVPGNEKNFTICPMLDSIERLTPDGMTLSLDTHGASFDPLEYDTVMGCGQIEELQSDGVWYAVIGTGKTMTISTCTQFFTFFDTQLLVYTLANQTTGCEDGLECVAWNDNFCGLQSAVSFVSKTDQPYFVYVSGTTFARLFSTPSQGEFSLTVSTSPEGSCQGAESIVPSKNGDLPVIHVGELLGGTFGMDPCNPEQQTHTGEQWYTVTGTGKYLVASTCHDLSNFEARLSVYTGRTCDDLTCVADDGVDCGNGREINWFAEEGTKYYLLVYTPNFALDVQFGLSVKEIW